jgi:hypothetical protein
MERHVNFVRVPRRALSTWLQCPRVSLIHRWSSYTFRMSASHMITEIVSVLCHRSCGHAMVLDGAYDVVIHTALMAAGVSRDPLPMAAGDIKPGGWSALWCI